MANEMDNRKVRIRLLTRRRTPTTTYRKGEVYQAYIIPGDRAVTNFGLILFPHEYELFIEDSEFEELLK